MYDSLSAEECYAPPFEATNAREESAAPTDVAVFTSALDSVVRRLAMARVPLTLFKLQFDGVPAPVARNIAVAVGGTAGLMGQIAPDVFVIADLGPRQVGGSAGTPMRRLSQRIRRLCDGAPSLCEGHVRIAELAFASDDGTPAKFLLTELDKRPSSCLPISDVPPSPAATTAGEPARRLRLPPGPTGGFASASVIPLPGTAMRVAVPVEG